MNGDDFQDTSNTYLEQCREQCLEDVLFSSNGTDFGLRCKSSRGVGSSM